MFWLLLATLFNLLGMGWLALAKDAHWKQAMQTAPKLKVTSSVPRQRLHAMGSAGLLLSLWACLQADPPSMAVLTWVMLLAVGASCVALILARRPRCLALLWRV